MHNVKVRLNAVLGHLYEAALEPDRWLSFVDTLAPLFSARGGHYQVVNVRTGEVEFSAMSHSPPDAQKAYVEHWKELDPTLAVGLQWPDNKLLFCHEFFDNRYVSNNEFYQDFLIPQAGVRYMAGSKATVAEEKSAFMVLFRSPGEQPFGEEERLLYNTITAHVERASRLYMAVTKLRLRASLGERALDAIAYPVMLVNERGVIALMNDAARAFLKHNGQLRVSFERLVCREPSTMEAIAHLIRNACKSAGMPRTGGTLTHPQDRGRQCLPAFVPAIVAGESACASLATPARAAGHCRY